MGHEGVGGEYVRAFIFLRANDVVFIHSLIHNGKRKSRVYESRGQLIFAHSSNGPVTCLTTPL